MTYAPEKLLDHVAEVHGCKTDAALSKLLDTWPPLISKIRSHKLGIGASLMLRIHELPAMDCMPFRDMRRMIGEGKLTKKNIILIRRKI